MKQYYDVLFTQEEGLKVYTHYVQDHLKDGSVIEMASGTGDLLNTLSQTHDVLGVDLDPDMLLQALDKFPELEGKMTEGDFCNFTYPSKFDNLVCIGDSLNYILSHNDLKQFVETASNLSDHLILDMHHPYRLIEFEDGYYEEGSLPDFDYAYEINCDGDYLMHIVNFLDGNFDAIQQWVFDPQILIDLLEAKNYKLRIFNDLKEGQIETEGEKVRIVATRI